MVDDSPNQRSGLTYAAAGVDIDAGNAFVDAIKPHIARTKRTGVMGGIGGFGGLFDLKACGYADPVLVAANDGVGTKLKLAFETGIHDTVGIDLVAMCVNDLVVQGAEPLFFLDYFATGHLQPGVAEQVVAGIASGCEIAGCALIGGETAEMPGMYTNDEYDLAGFAVGAVERGEIRPRADLTAGDVLIALPSSGPHSNGFSLIRRLVAEKQYGWNDIAPFSTDARTLGEALLKPTRIYVKPLLAALGTGIKALAHITGGGMTENIPRVLPHGLAARIDLPRIGAGNPTVNIFAWLADEGGIARNEMLKTFNCGVGMVLVVSREDADKVSERLAAAGETPFLLGGIVNRNGGDSVIYTGKADFLS